MKISPSQNAGTDKKTIIMLRRIRSVKRPVLIAARAPVDIPSNRAIISAVPVKKAVGLSLLTRSSCHLEMSNRNPDASLLLPTNENIDLATVGPARIVSEGYPESAWIGWESENGWWGHREPGG